jgi:hypothetical protein
MAKLWNPRAYSARLALVYLLARAHPLSSQVTGTLPPAIRVQVLDSASGRPLQRTWSHQWRRGGDGRSIWVGSSRANTANGVLELNGVSGSYAQVLCARDDGLYGGHDLATLDSVQPAAAGGDTLLLRVNGAACDRRELRIEYATWIGHYRSGFEESHLRLCEDSVRKIWVEYTPGFWTGHSCLGPRGTTATTPRTLLGSVGRWLVPTLTGTSASLLTS